jgi:hypothetical protein
MLSEIISEDVNLNLVEPNIYSVYSIGDSPGAYDVLGASTIYDVVACNRLYNWLMWGYSIKDYATFIIVYSVVVAQNLSSAIAYTINGVLMRLFKNFVMQCRKPSGRFFRLCRKIYEYRAC